MDLYENRSENSLKRDPSNDTTVNPPLFSLVNTFKLILFRIYYGIGFIRSILRIHRDIPFSDTNKISADFDLRRVRIRRHI
jgi:hypothetical protein